MTTSPTRVRPAAVQGAFYDRDARSCAVRASHLCRPCVRPVAELPPVLHGALVPHAGWCFSGRVAGEAISTLAGRSAARTFVLTGTVHGCDLEGPAVDEADGWITPLGRVPVDEALRAAITRLEGFVVCDDAHGPEHSLEVQVPLLQTSVGPGLRIVPCLVPTSADAATWGERLGALLRGWLEPVAVVASSDLTHYGPRFGFVPHGVGDAGARWAHEVNDRGLLGLVEDMDAPGIAVHAKQHHSACGGGAIAVTARACRVLGARRGFVLRHTDSTRERVEPEPVDVLDSVGYAGVVFG